MLYLALIGAVLGVAGYFLINAKNSDVKRMLGAGLLLISLFVFYFFFYFVSVADDYARGIIDETTEVKQYKALQEANLKVIELFASYLPIIAPAMAGLFLLFYVEKWLYARK